MHLINIGNSRGIRIPKSTINKYGFSKGITIVEVSDCIKILPTHQKLRKNWQEFYQKNSTKLDVDMDFLECDINDDVI